MTAPIRKPGGWKGHKTDAFWTKASAYGQRYMCSKCGRDVLGYGAPNRMHWSDCPVYVEWKAKRDAEEAETKAKTRLAAGKWHAEHAQAFLEAFRACEDVEVLRAAAMALGYTDGAK